MDELLATVRFKDGSVKFIRAGKGLRIEGSDLEVSLPRATGQQTISIFSLFEALGNEVEYPEDEEELS
jgi:hypothetical protein